MRFESQTHPQDDHIDRITDYSTRYGQAHSVSTRVRLAKGRCTMYMWSIMEHLIVNQAHIRRSWDSIGDGGKQRKIVNFRPTFGLNLQDSNMLVSRMHTVDIEPNVVPAF